MTRRPRYLKAIERHLRATGIEPGRIVHVEVRHDDDCAVWRREPCDCEPVIETGARVDQRYGGGER